MALFYAPYYVVLKMPQIYRVMPDNPFDMTDNMPDDTALPDEEWEAKVQAFLAEHAQRHQER